MLLALVLSTAWLSHPLIANLHSLVARARKASGKGSLLRGRRESSQNLGTPGVLPKPSTSHSESRPPMSKQRPTEADATRGGPHHVPRLRPAQCMLRRKLDIVQQNVPTKEKRLHFHLANVHLVHTLWAVKCSMSCVMVQPNKIKTRLTSKTLLLSQSRVWRGLQILDGATKTVSGFMSVQPVADQYEETTIETTDVGFTFAGGETDAASMNIWIPHAEFPQGISVSVVSNESTLFFHRFGCDM